MWLVDRIAWFQKRTDILGCDDSRRYWIFGEWYFPLRRFTLLQSCSWPPYLSTDCHSELSCKARFEADSMKDADTWSSSTLLRMILRTLFWFYSLQQTSLDVPFPGEGVVPYSTRNSYNSPRNFFNLACATFLGSSVYLDFSSYSSNYSQLHRDSPCRHIRLKYIFRAILFLT